MLLELTKLNSLAVATFEDNGLIGRVEKTLISKEDQKAIGFLVKLSGWLKSRKVASLEDVISIDQAGIVLRSNESLVDQGEIVRIQQIIDSRFNLLSLPCRTKNGHYIGRVSDALIETDSGLIMRLYVKKIFSYFVFERSQIISIKKDYIILDLERGQKKDSKVKSLASAKIA